MNRISWTTSDIELKEWDDFLKTHKRGHYLQTSPWLKSFKSYNFDYNVLLVRDNSDKIIAGMGTVTAGFGIFKVFVSPCSPIISKGHEDLFEEMIEEFLTMAKKVKAFYCHINAPILKIDNANISDYCLNIIANDSVYFSGKEGIKFKHVSSINGFRPVVLNYNKGVDPYNIVFKGFNSNTKRNINKANKNNLEISFATSEDDIKKAYDIILENGLTQGYSVRAWEDMKDMLLHMIKENLAIVPCCFHENKLIGALVVFEVGQRLTYISGGTLRTEGDLKIGHFLHNEMIKYSIAKKYSFYDISVGGSPGVTRFKKGFNGCHVEFLTARHWILDTFKYKLYTKLSPQINKHKALVSKILKRFK